MLKAHSKSKKMRRSSRIFLNDINTNKKKVVISFLETCRNITQYFVDLFWQRKDFSAELADTATTNLARKKFSITARLAQVVAKSAKEAVRAVVEQSKQSKRKLTRPKIRKHVTTLDQRFVSIEKYNNGSFDYVLKFIGSGGPKLVIPFHSTRHLNKFVESGWVISKSIRVGRIKDRLFIDIIVEKDPTPLIVPKNTKKYTENVVGMDSNYKNGLVFSDGQSTGTKIYEKIKSFDTRQKNTHKEVKNIVNYQLKRINWNEIHVLVIENLKRVKNKTFGKFPKEFNRRLSHWLYAYIVERLEQICEEKGIRLEFKDPFKTSQFCRFCYKWDRRNRSGDKFHCRNCDFTDHADHNASKNLELLGLAGEYSLRSLTNPKLQMS